MEGAGTDGVYESLVVNLVIVHTVNYLKMHDIKMHKSNSAYELDGNQLREQ